MVHRHHPVRNLAFLAAAASAAVIYTIISDTRYEFPNHPPLTIPNFLSSPNFVPTVIADNESNHDHDRFDVELSWRER